MSPKNKEVAKLSVLPGVSLFAKGLNVNSLELHGDWKPGKHLFTIQLSDHSTTLSRSKETNRDYLALNQQHSHWLRFCIFSLFLISSNLLSSPHLACFSVSLTYPYITLTTPFLILAC